MSDQTDTAVLVPFDRAASSEETRVGFIVRSSESSSHENDIGFPGGKREADDNSLRDTAQREAVEELALTDAGFQVTDTLDSHQTRSSGFAVQPFLGLVTTPAQFTPGSREITETFWVELSALRSAYEMDGDRIRYRLADPAHEIWGVTARIVTSILVTDAVPTTDR